MELHATLACSSLARRGISVSDDCSPPLAHPSPPPPPPIFFSTGLMSGIVLWEIFEQAMPFGQDANDTIALRRRVCAGERPAVSPTMPADFRAAMEACWAQDSAARPSFAEILQLSFLRA